MRPSPVLLDIDRFRVAIQGGVELSWGGVVQDVPILVVDTGCTMHIIAPEKEVDVASFPPDFTVQEFGVIGGDQKWASVFVATLRIGGNLHPEDVEVWVVEGQEQWLLGLPVLRHYNLILRDDDARGPRLEG